MLSPSELGEQIKSVRTFLGLSQAELADRSGLARDVVVRLENNRTKGADLYTLERLAVALNVPVAVLMRGAGGRRKDLIGIVNELSWLGVTDLHVANAELPICPRNKEEVIVLALSGNRPSPRVLEAMPAALAWNEFSPKLLAGFADVHDGRALHRAAWLADVTLSIHGDFGFPGGGVRDPRALEGVISLAGRPAETDFVGHGDVESMPPVWKRWNVVYEAGLGDFRGRAQRIHELNRGARQSFTYGR